MALAQNNYYRLVKNMKFPHESKKSDRVRSLKSRINNLQKKLSKERDDLKIYDLRKRLNDSKQELLALSASSEEFYRFVKQKQMSKTKSTASVQRCTKRYEIPSNWTHEYIASTAFLESFEWKRLRYDVLKYYETLNAKRCMVCNAERVVLNVDHIKSRKFYPHLALDGGNLQILCGDCNHGKANTTHDHRPKIIDT